MELVCQKASAVVDSLLKGCRWALLFVEAGLNALLQNTRFFKVLQCSVAYEIEIFIMYCVLQLLTCKLYLRKIYT